MKELIIQGTVLCKKCGGQIISNTGKIMYNHKDNTLKCWECERVINANVAYSNRKENQIVKL